MLISLSEVLESSLYATQVGESLSNLAANEAEQMDYQNEAPALLLQMCLEELTTSFSKKAFSIQSQSLKRFWSMLLTNKQTTTVTSQFRAKLIYSTRKPCLDIKKLSRKRI